MKAKTKFNPFQLRVGDRVWVQDGSHRRVAEVIHRGRTYLSPIAVRFDDYEERWFSSKEGTDAIIAGARKVEGKWQPL